MPFKTFKNPVLKCPNPGFCISLSSFDEKKEGEKGGGENAG